MQEWASRCHLDSGHRNLSVLRSDDDDEILSNLSQDILAVTRHAL